MQDETSPFEVEIRFAFDSLAEARRKIPFLDGCLKEIKPWKSSIYGPELFHFGSLLRIGTIFPETNPISYLCLKGPDAGRYANIRREMEEVITNGVSNSAVLGYLGGTTGAAGPEEVSDELERLGHVKFMSFEGIDTFGRYEPYDINVKQMECPELGYPLIIEFEKIASSEEEAFQFEDDLQRIAGELNLEDSRVHDEPPTLLYRARFGKH